ncbi:hypothetical protein NDU88_002157 [Pleurodeles waltl]|uniref:Reverse transcriptase domain-containing protein n=1 Tax=Pleurodeles waltl TaxID=8319 RepID=A0AAV7W1N0_PLEWA|nr:hypothetical protein NDU88_002157 [Pleurodeles waltl]
MIAIYADDVVVTLDDRVRSLPIFLEEVKAFGAVSGFRMNLSKSRALDLALPGEMRDKLTQCCPFQWEESSVPYLGLRVARTVRETASINYRLLLRGVRVDLAEWRCYSISWTGRIADIKILILPRVLFLFQTLPVEPPSSSLQTLQREINRFICGSKRPRMAELLVVSDIGVVRPAYSDAVVRPAYSDAVVRPAYSDAVVRPAYSDAVVRPAYSDAVVRPAYSDAVVRSAYSDAVVWSAYSDAVVWSAYSDAVVRSAYSDAVVRSAYSGPVCLQ